MKQNERLTYIDPLDNVSFPLLTNTISNFLHEVRFIGRRLFTSLNTPTTSNTVSSFLDEVRVLGSRLFTSPSPKIIPNNISLVFVQYDALN